MRLSEGEVGKAGVAIDSLADMEILFNGIELEKITTSMTINATAAVLLSMYVALSEATGSKPCQRFRNDTKRYSERVRGAAALIFIRRSPA
jgi:methylmalonyl-CoA mutase N-terminal domain/subunit